jgi:hypothetical protein
MPTLAVFFGITIRMYFDDHPPPHFHAYYGSYSAKIAIETLAVIEGELPRRALGLVFEWATEHRVELMEDWERAEAHLPLLPINALD